MDSYDVLPGRVVFYLWPRTAGVSFSFDFRSRFPLRAMSAPAQLYNYYNPKAAVTVAPMLF